MELPVRQLRHGFDRARDAGVALDVVVPRRKLGVAQRPIDGDAFARVRFEIEVAPAIALPSPQQRAAADVIAAIPIEALDLGVRRILLVDPPIEVALVQRVVAAQDAVRLLHRIRAPAAVRVLPRALVGIHVVLGVLDVLAALEQEHGQPFLRELLRRPAAGYTGADDDRVVIFVGHYSWTPSVIAGWYRMLATIGTRTAMKNRP